MEDDIPDRRGEDGGRAVLAVGRAGRTGGETERQKQTRHKLVFVPRHGGGEAVQTSIARYAVARRPEVPL